MFPTPLRMNPPAKRTVQFDQQVKSLALSTGLEKKILFFIESPFIHSPRTRATYLLKDEEKELASEMLLRRHAFTRMLIQTQFFRQAALTVIQNLYLFQNRKIYFDTTFASTELERQDALLLFSNQAKTSIPLGKTLQYAVAARIWKRIRDKAPERIKTSDEFIALQEIIDTINALRNCYILLTVGLVSHFARKIRPIYKESLAFDDAVQAGCIGAGNAAYRYHPQHGIRFSTFAAPWIQRQIQKEALQGRLIRISTNVIEKSARAIRSGNLQQTTALSACIRGSAVIQEEASILHHRIDTGSMFSQPGNTPHDMEITEQYAELTSAVDSILPLKWADILKRRYGLPPFEHLNQSIVAISKHYGVTRSSIYQLERKALQLLRHHFSNPPPPLWLRAESPNGLDIQEMTPVDAEKR